MIVLCGEGRWVENNVFGAYNGAFHSCVVDLVGIVAANVRAFVGDVDVVVVVVGVVGLGQQMVHKMVALVHHHTIGYYGCL